MNAGRLEQNVCKHVFCIDFHIMMMVVTAIPRSTLPGPINLGVTPGVGDGAGSG